MMVRGKPFEKGNKASPGRPKKPEDLKDVQKLTRTEIEGRITKFAKMSREELRQVISDPKTIVMDLMIARVIEKSFSTGDHQRLDFLFNRLIGKVPQQVEAGENGFVIKIEDYTADNK